MGNKLKQIHLANILLEQRYLREQAQTTTGATQSPMTGGTQTPTGTTQTPPPTTEVKPSSQSKPKYTLDDIIKMSKQGIDSKLESKLESELLKCSTPNLEKVSKIGNLNIHKLEDGVNFCIG